MVVRTISGKWFITSVNKIPHRIKINSRKVKDFNGNESTIHRCLLYRDDNPRKSKKKYASF